MFKINKNQERQIVMQTQTRQTRETREVSWTHLELDDGLCGDVVSRRLQPLHSTPLRHYTGTLNTHMHAVGTSTHTCTLKVHRHATRVVSSFVKHRFFF